MKKLSSCILVLVISIFPALQAKELPPTFNVSVPRPDGAEKGNVTLSLTRYSVRDPDFFKLYVDKKQYENRADKKGADTDSFQALPTEQFPVRTYRGHVAEQPNSSVVAVVWPGDKTISVMVSEGKRILWTIDDLGISIAADNKVSVTSPTKYFADIVKLNTRKSWDWQPTFGQQPLDLKSTKFSAEVDRSLAHGWPITPNIKDGITRVQMVVDAEPEWFALKAKGSTELALAIIEHNVNIVDLVYVRDLSMSHVLTSYIQRMDTNLHVKAGDTIKTWKDHGLGLNPGSVNTVAGKSIPFQQVVWAFVNEGNPFAYRSKQPLNGGNYSRVPLSKENADGISHEIGHNWGGSHFVYPRDSMSGGGPWFGPTTAQKMLFLRNSTDVAGELAKITNKEYGWNVHPYATPDLVRIDKDQRVELNVLGNDYDGNGDNIALAQVPLKSLKGGQISQDGNRLFYTPKPGFQGRDRFSYQITDGQLTNDTWVQIDVGGDLLLSYRFESLPLAMPDHDIVDSSGSNLHGKLTNFAGKASLTEGIVGNGLSFPWLMLNNDAQLPDTKSLDSVRPFVEIGDVVDPLDGDHSVSMWVKFDEKSLNSGMPVYLLSNSSSVIHTLVSGYNIFTDKSAQSIHFNLREQLSLNSQSELTPLRQLSYTPPGGLQANNWYHLVLVIDRTTNLMSAYVNGVPLKAETQTSVALTPGSFIKGKPEGGRYISSGLGVSTYKPKKYGPFAGVMDEVLIYGRTLSNKEVAEQWNNTTVNVGH